MPEIYIFYFDNPYTEERLQIFAENYEAAIVELSQQPINSVGFQYIGMEKFEEDLGD